MFKTDTMMKEEDQLLMSQTFLKKWTRDDNLVTVDIEEAFNYLHQIFLLVIIKSLALVIISLIGLKFEPIKNHLFLMTVPLHHTSI